jgi:hypothetical protein
MKTAILEALTHIQVASSSHLSGAYMRYLQASPRNDALPCAGEINSSFSVGPQRSRPAFPRRIVQELL